MRAGTETAAVSLILEWLFSFVIVVMQERQSAAGVRPTARSKSPVVSLREVKVEDVFSFTCCTDWCSHVLDRQKASRLEPVAPVWLERSRASSQEASACCRTSARPTRQPDCWEHLAYVQLSCSTFNVV